MIATIKSSKTHPCVDDLNLLNSSSFSYVKILMKSLDIRKNHGAKLIGSLLIVNPRFVHGIALPMANSSPVNRLLQDAFSHFFPDPGPNDLDLPPPSIPRQSPFHSREGSTHDGGVLEEGELSSESAAILLEAVRLEIKQDNLEQVIPEDVA